MSSIWRDSRRNQCTKVARNWRQRANLKIKKTEFTVGVFFSKQRTPRSRECVLRMCILELTERSINELARVRSAAVKPTSLIIEPTLAHASAKSGPKRWRNWSAAELKDCVVTWISAMRHLPMNINHSFMPLCATLIGGIKVRWEKKKY